MKALYRKYRPITLDQVIGQEAIVSSLKTALKNGKISHAYMFVGPRGCGKTSVARIFAHEINGFKYELEDSYVDIIEIDAASNTGVDNIRDLREKAVIAPTQGKYKVYIIDEVHMLSKSAFNALLKLLEEPPEHVIFIMATTNPEKVPVTITSRAQTFTFRLADPETMQRHLEQIAKSEKIDATPEAISVVVRRGGGSFRDSISLLDQISTLKEGKITAEDVTSALGLPTDQISTDLLIAYVSGDQQKITDILKDLLNSGQKPETLVDELIKKILASPSPELLSLLSKLPDVQPPFSEAKLLLAFLGSGSAPALTPTAFPPAEKKLRSEPSENEKIPKPNDGASSSDVSASISPAKSKESSISVKSPQEKPTPPVSPTTFPPAKEETYIPDATEKSAPEVADFSAGQSMTSPTESGAVGDTGGVGLDWETFLREIEPENINIFKYLSQSKPKLSGTTLHIYASKKIEARILDSKNNKALISSHAKGFAIEIHGPDELPKEKSNSQFDQISAIMGTVQEVKSDGTPF